MWPPSTPRRAAILPCLRASRISAAVVARTTSFGCLRTVRGRHRSGQRAIHGFRSGDFTRHPDGKENRTQIAFAHGGEYQCCRSSGASRDQIVCRGSAVVVSSCVSTTMDEKCSLRALSEMLSAFIAPARNAPAATHAPAHRIARAISRLLILLLRRLHLFAVFLRLFHHSENIAPQNLSNVIFLVALSHQGFRDF